MRNPEVVQDKSPEAAGRELIEWRRAGGPDNITLQILRVS